MSLPDPRFGSALKLTADPPVDLATCWRTAGRVINGHHRRDGPPSVREAPEVDWEYREQARGLKALCFLFKGWAEDADSPWWNPFGR